MKNKYCHWSSSEVHISQFIPPFKTWILLLFFISFNGLSTLYGQDSLMNKDSTFVLQKSSVSEVFYIDVPQDAELITFRVEGQIESGKLSVKLIDAMGWRNAGFSLKAGKGGAKGHIEEIYDSPVSGRWKVKLKTTKASGDLKFSVQVQ